MGVGAPFDRTRAELVGLMYPGSDIASLSCMEGYWYCWEYEDDISGCARLLELEGDFVLARLAK